MKVNRAGRVLCLPETAVPELLGSSCGAGLGEGLDCLLGDVCGGRKAKQRGSPAQRKAVPPRCVYAPQVPQPKEELTL